MAGIYIHIPFCKQRCTYCDFYTQVAPHLIPDLVEALLLEIEFRQDYLPTKEIDTIYFGGGTPSLLTIDQFKKIFEVLFRTFKINPTAEITFEANPDDLTEEFLTECTSLPFNRISMGIQSFDNDQLRAINRRHTGEQAINAVKNAQKYGFHNISIDLIYGLPGQRIDSWKQQLATAFELQVQHISVYGLTYEENTKLWEQREKGIILPADDDTMISMYEILLEEMKLKGYDAYEISNFCIPGWRSKHNSAYWKLTPYLGIGPSAHSFDGNSRQWNVDSTTQYISAIHNKKIPCEKEDLSLEEKYNDFVMVSLRTREGIDMTKLKEIFGAKLTSHCLEQSKKHLEANHLIYKNNHIYLTEKHIQISDLIIRDLLYV